MGGRRVGYHRGHAGTFKGMDLAAVFSDDSAIGPGWAALVRFIQPGDTVVVPEPSRLTRRMSQLEGMLANLRALGVSVEFLDD